MELQYVPLLGLQRDFYAKPRGLERFREYLRMMIGVGSGDLKLPLAPMNPMGKEHVLEFLDALLACDGDGVAARAVDGLRAALVDEPGAFRVALCATDDLKGGWTDRGASEFTYRFEQGAYTRRGWITALLWTSERYDAERVATEVRACLWRTAYVRRHGAALTLGERLEQEGAVLAAAGARLPALDADELGYTGEVLAPLLGTRDWATAVAALFGDAAAKKLGLRPLGLAREAGLAWALWRSRAGASERTA